MDSQGRRSKGYPRDHAFSGCRVPPATLPLTPAFSLASHPPLLLARAPAPYPLGVGCSNLPSMRNTPSNEGGGENTTGRNMTTLACWEKRQASVGGKSAQTHRVHLDSSPTIPFAVVGR